MSAKTILIVDDDRNIQSMLRLCLASPQYAVSIASDGAQALVIITHELPNLVLLDLAMPVMDGMTALMHIHDMPASGRPRVIVMTAHGSVRAAIQAIRLGAEDFLEKPFTPDDVRLSVASVLDDTAMAGPGDESDFNGVLRSVRQALRAGTLSAAETLLMRAGTIADDDPAFLNLAGVLHESRGRVKSALRFYQKASAKDEGYYAAQQNMLRMMELRRTGRSRRPVALGDEPLVAVAQNEN